MSGASKRRPELGGMTPKEKAFADLILEGKNKTQAAKDALDITSYDSARNAGSIMSKQDKVREYLAHEGYGAATRIVDLSINAKDEGIRLAANKDILDRAGFAIPKGATAIQINIGKDQDEYS